MYHTYKSAWSPSVPDSAQFKNKNYKNPKIELVDKTFTSKKAMMGTYKIDILSLYPLLKR